MMTYIKTNKRKLKENGYKHILFTNKWKKQLCDTETLILEVNDWTLKRDSKPLEEYSFLEQIYVKKLIKELDNLKIDDVPTKVKIVLFNADDGHLYSYISEASSLRQCLSNFILDWHYAEYSSIKEYDESQLVKLITDDAKRWNKILSIYNMTAKEYIYDERLTNNEEIYK